MNLAVASLAASSQSSLSTSLEERPFSSPSSSAEDLATAARRGTLCACAALDLAEREGAL